MAGALTSVYNNAAFALSMNAEVLARLQEQASSGSRINRASDDPSSAYRVLGLNAEKSLLSNYVDNLSEVTASLEFASSIFNDMTAQLAEVKTRMTQVVTDTSSDQTRELIAGGVDNILEQMLALANTKHMQQYLFGGGDTDSAPYTIERDADGKIIGVTYQGSLENRDIEVSRGLEMSVFHIGDEAFRADNRDETEFIGGTTGAAPGTGTSSVRGYVWLEVTQPGGAGNPYFLSIDGGLTTVQADGTENQMVTDSRTGRVLYVDTRAISGTGVELVNNSGTHDVFETLIAIRDLCRNEGGFSENQLQDMRNNVVELLDEMRNLLLQDSVSVGSKIEFLDNLKNGLEDIKLNTDEETTRIEQADIAQIAIDISRRQVLYQMSLAVVAKIMSMSLLDFIT
jgi:flagellar hook-associated protein 3 FlgL